MTKYKYNYTIKAKSRHILINLLKIEVKKKISKENTGKHNMLPIIGNNSKDNFFIRDKWRPEK